MCVQSILWMEKVGSLKTLWSRASRMPTNCLLWTFIREKYEPVNLLLQLSLILINRMNVTICNAMHASPLKYDKTIFFHLDRDCLSQEAFSSLPVDLH